MMAKPRVHEINLNDEDCSKGKVGFQWVNNNILAAYGCVNSQTQQRATPSGHTLGTVHFLREDSILCDPELRKLINESNLTFLASRTLKPNVDSRKRILDLSREHRSSLRSCIENMVSSMKSRRNDMYKEWVDVLDNIDLVWHLCELLHIVPVQMPLQKLLEWTRLHSGHSYDLLVPEVLSASHTRGANHRYPDYWNLVTGLLLKGQFDTVRAILNLHSDSQSSSFIEAASIIMSIPLFSVYSGISVPEFQSRWRGWKTNLRSKITSGIFTSCPQLLKLMKIMDGGKDLFDLVKPFCPTWYDMMSAVLIFTDQTVKTDDLSSYAKKCIVQYGGPSQLKLLDHTLLALLDSDIVTAIKKLQLTADGGWCAVHLTNLLHIAGALNARTEKELDFENMLLDYGKFLASDPSMWQVGLTYLDQCSENGRQAMELALSSLPLTSEEKAYRIIWAAKEYDLGVVEESVCRVMASKQMEMNNLAGALSWALISNDDDLASSVAEKYLIQYSFGKDDAEISCSTILTKLGQSILVSPLLTFLARYCEFHSLFGEEKFKEAAIVLIKLIESKASPKWFWLTLLSDAVPLLEKKDDSYFSHDDVTILMGAMEELTTEVKEDLIPNLKFEASFIQRTAEIRRLIVRRFASTLLQESAAAHTSISRPLKVISIK